MTATTTPPAPCQVAWCDQHDNGHPYDSHTPDGRGDARVHCAVIGDLRTDDALVRPSSREVFVDLTSVEELHIDADGVRVSVEVPRIALTANYVRLSRAQALGVAQLLLTAADRLGAIA